MTGGEVIRSLNRAGLSARLIAGRVYISPASKLTGDLSRLVMENRDELIHTLANFGMLNEVDPEARGLSHDRWLRSLPLSAFIKGNR